MAPGEDDGELSCKKGLRMKRLLKRQGRGVCPHLKSMKSGMLFRENYDELLTRDIEF